MKLPEPVGTVVDPTYVAMSQQQPYGTALYTEAQLKQAVRDFGEQCVQHCLSIEREDSLLFAELIRNLIKEVA